MEHIGIDLGGRESQICIRDEEGKMVLERRCFTRELGQILSQRAAGRVVVETCAEAFSVADEAKRWGHDVRVVPSTLAPSLGVGARRTKTDVRDARVLSEVSCRVDLPSVHIPSELSRERKSLCGSRDSLIAARTQLVNHVRGWLRTQRIRLRTGMSETFVTRVRQLQLELPAFIEPVLKSLEALQEQVDELDQQLQRTVQKDPLCQRLMSVPGVGPVTAVRFLAALDERERFADAHKVEAYLGLVPGEHSSGERKHRTSITKAGPSALRWTLVQAAWAARRSRGTHPMLQWAGEVEKRRGKHVATVALARKIAGILYALWRDGTRYSPLQGLQRPAAA